MRFPARFASFVFILAACLPCAAQYSIGSIVIHGNAPYSDAEVLAVSGLQAGQMLAPRSLAGAGQRLMDTGMFDDAEVSLSGQGKARTVLVALKPVAAATLLPCGFANFVWFTPQELTAGIRARVPLYRGAAPEAGNTQDAIQAALQQMLSAKGVTATLSHSVVEPSNEHPWRVVEFRIDAPRIVIGTVTVAGDHPNVSDDALDAYLKRRAGHAYSEGLSGFTMEDLLLNKFRDAGYVTAKLEDVHRSIAPSSGSGAAVQVNYSARVVTGPLYTVKNVSWTPTPVYSAADFARDSKPQPVPGGAMTMLMLARAKIVKAYHAQGYLDAYVTTGQQLDDSAHTISYELGIVPGAQYHLKTVTALNLSPEARTEFDSAWRMKPGDVYNESYIGSFITNNTALPHLAAYTATFQASADPQTHEVDLTLNFIPPAR